MLRNTSVTLGNHFADFIDDRIESGRYGSASEVIRAGLRLMEDHEARIEALRAALIEGEESGPATPIDFDAFHEGKTDRQKSDDRWPLLPGGGIDVIRILHQAMDATTRLKGD